MGVVAAFWQQRAVPPVWLRFASADVSWFIWIEVVITKWGDMKAADLAKEQGDHTISALTDVQDMWNHQE